ncbi:hypothetical protein ONE63_000921 [Megalurothrips usitatus]|uniref:Peptidoglycan-recognition protein n=1 Tax=Megalurothrips usitatus TaxID=439358 RepID=A0AAV7Y3W0_9NEOP|nr:hypothetical protein ONE63_000921 [Megalurothrips usitatus]
MRVGGSAAGAAAASADILGPLRLLLVLAAAAAASLTPQAGAACPSIVGRQRWGAAESQAVRYIAFPVPEVVVGHTAGAACSSLTTCSREVHTIQQQHRSQDFGDIGYSFLIGGDGLVYEGRGWHKQGAHTYGYNKRAIGVAFLGDYSDTPASAGQMAALRDLIRCGVELGELGEDVRLYGQRQVQSTESPGLALYQQLQDLPEWVERVPADPAVDRVMWRSKAN